MSVDEVLRGAAAELHAEVRAGVDPEAALEEVQQQGRPAGRRWLPVAPAVVVLLGVAAAVVVAVSTDGEEDGVAAIPPTTVEREVDGPAPGVSEGVVIEATPAEGLVDGQEVRVTAEGLPEGAGVQVQLAMCRGDAMARGSGGFRGPGAVPCTFWPLVEPLTPEGGRLDTTYAVQRILSPDDIHSFDCARDPVPCAIGVFVDRGIPPASPEEPLGPELVGIVGVGFAPLGPPPEPRITITPTEGLTHGQVVTIEGEGFEGTVGAASICAPSVEEQACLYVELAGDELGGRLQPVGGSFRAEVPMWRAFPWTSRAAVFDVLDCAQVECVVEISDQLGRPSNAVAVAFADGPPPEPPTLEATPSTGLRPGDPVTLTARGVVPGEEVQVFACILDGATCGPSAGIATMTAGADGVATLTQAATDPAEFGQTCVEPGACGVALGMAVPGGDPLLDLVRPVPMQYAPPG